MHSPRTKSIAAFTRIELLAIIASVLVGLAIILPVLARSQARSSKIGCPQSLKQIGLAFRTWAIDNNDRFPMQLSVTNDGTMELVSSGRVFPHFLVMSNELSTPKILTCPTDKDRTYVSSFAYGLADTNLSYFINVDAVQGNGSSFLCGDRNLKNKPPAGSRFVCLSSSSVIGWNSEMHRQKGNLCFADGSVQGFLNGAVASAVRIPGGVTNRLAIP
jgi:prepilin-type processing-associated H-X9-DG protein